MKHRATATFTTNHTTFRLLDDCGRSAAAVVKENWKSVSFTIEQVCAAFLALDPEADLSELRENDAKEKLDLDKLVMNAWSQGYSLPEHIAGFLRRTEPDVIASMKRVGLGDSIP